MKFTRREFIKTGVASTAVLALDPKSALSDLKGRYDPKGLPTRVLGSTGIRVPLIGIGTGTRFCSVGNEDEAQQILEFALDNGFYYWDTASIYGKGDVVSEVRLGRMLKHRRAEVFLATKCRERDPDAARREIERSLERLQTDHVDLLQIHSVESMDDLTEITREKGMFHVLQSLKEQGVTRFIGFSGHRSAQAMSRACRDYDFDTMLIALNHFLDHEEKFEENAVSAAAERKMGVMVMKVIRPRETVAEIDSGDLVRYSLSLKNVTGAVIGIDSIQVLKDNKDIISKFEPLDETRMRELRMSLSPFYQNPGLEWLHPEYRDGMLA